MDGRQVVAWSRVRKTARGCLEGSRGYLEGYRGGLEGYRGGLEGYRGGLEGYRGSSRVFANANCIGGVRFKGCAKGGRTSMDGGRFEVCLAVACKASKPTTKLRRKCRGGDGPRRNGGVGSDTSKRWWVPPRRMRRRCIALGLQPILKPKSKLFEELIGDAAIRSTIGAYRGW